MKKIIVFIICLIPLNVLGYDIPSKSLILMDRDSNRVLLSKNSNDKRLIASTTKVMTAILAIEYGKLDDVVLVGDEVLKSYGSNIYINKGESILLIDLIYGLMLRSGNDCSLIIAKHIGKTEENFINMMNNKAKELGMRDTTFSNPSGLDDDTKNISTAHDMAILMSYASKNSTFLEIASTKNYKTESDKKVYVWKNRCELLFNYPYLTSCKTGYTPKAGKILATSASKNNLNLVMIGFDYGYDYEMQKEIYEDYFRRYKNYKIIDKDKFNIKYNGLTGYINNDFYYPLNEEEIDRVVTKIELNKKVLNNELGNIYIYLDNEFLHKEIIYAKEKENLFSKLFHFFK